jgi:uncharacterized protein (TIGR02145 family)
MKTIQIGSQVWTTKNLRVFKFRNGDPIPIVQDIDEWLVSFNEAAMCINPDNGECYYNWHAVDDPRGLAPEGFHVPSHMEWLELIRYCGGDEIAGNLLKSTKKWDGIGPVKGFNATPSGRRSEDIDFYSNGNHGSWWSSTPNGSSAWYCSMESDCSNVSRSYGYIQDPRYGFSVRLIKD